MWESCWGCGGFGGGEPKASFRVLSQLGERRLGGPAVVRHSHRRNIGALPLHWHQVSDDPLPALWFIV